MEQGGETWLLSSSGKLVEKTNTAAEATRVTGLTALEPEAGETLQVDAEQQSAKETLLTLLAALNSREALSRCQEIHLEDGSYITLRFDGRFDVLLSWDADFGYKLDCLLAVVDTKLEENEKGTIDLTRKEVRFVPG